MGRPTLRKNLSAAQLAPNVGNYADLRATFTWEAAAAKLAGLPRGQGLNMAHEAVDRHAAGPRATHVAIRWLSKGGETVDLSYADLQKATNRFANTLEHLGVKKGDRVFTLLGRVPELYVTALGTLKHRAVYCPLFSAFGQEPVRVRMQKGGATVLVTTAALYRRKVAAIRAALPDLKHVLLLGRPNVPTEIPETLDFHTLMGQASHVYEIGPTDPEDPALLHFTSGTTGAPKGALHVHQAAVVHCATGRMALDLHADDIYWCTADPGWVTGTSYGIMAPLCNGVCSVVDEEEFDAERWYRNIEEQRVTVWYTAPTAIRMLMRVGAQMVRRFDLSSVRFMASVGEPLNPEAVVWGNDVLGLPIHDNWWQTETGGIMIANFASTDVKPGSMGLPIPGIDAAIVRREGKCIRVVEEPNTQGELALRVGWPSMFRAYIDQEARYAACFVDGWYLSGDLARRDDDGYFWFIGRADDLIKSAGHLIGPFEVESALVEHPAVVEAAVIGKPDELAGAIVKAFVSVGPGVQATSALRRDILGFARARLGPAVAPREIDIVDGLPKTRSGKIMRRLLKARELGLPEGDTSTLEDTT